MLNLSLKDIFSPWLWQSHRLLGDWTSFSFNKFDNSDFLRTCYKSIFDFQTSNWNLEANFWSTNIKYPIKLSCVTFQREFLFSFFSVFFFFNLLDICSWLKGISFMLFAYFYSFDRYSCICKSLNIFSSYVKYISHIFYFILKYIF